MTLFLLVGRPIPSRPPPRSHHPLPIIRMKHALPTLALHFFLSETLEREPLRVEEIQRAIGWTAPDLLRDCIDHKPQAVLTSPQCIFRPLTVGNFLSQRLVDSFMLQRPLGYATLHL